MANQIWLPEERVCPICKKKFVPAIEHAWKIGHKRSDVIDAEGKYEDNRENRLVCTYSCMRKWEKQHGYFK